MADSLCSSQKLLFLSINRPQTLLAFHSVDDANPNLKNFVQGRTISFFPLVYVNIIRIKKRNNVIGNKEKKEDNASSGEGDRDKNRIIVFISINGCSNVACPMNL